jgi:hypothetical protein
VNWAKRFKEVSASSGDATFGSDFGGLNLNPRSTLSVFRPPFAEPDPRVHLLPDAAVPSRPNYDVFGVGADAAPTGLTLPEWVKNVGGAFTVIPHGAPGAPTQVSSSTSTALTTFASTFGVLVTVLGVVIGAFTLGHLQGVHHRRRAR